jgi:hypothetical protein
LLMFTLLPGTALPVNRKASLSLSHSPEVYIMAS